MTDKKTLKSWRSPDSLQVWFMQFTQGIYEQRQVIAIVLFPALLLGGGFVGWKFFQRSQSEKLRDKIAAVDLSVGKKSEEHSKKRMALEKDITRLKAIAAPKPEDLTALSTAEQQLKDFGTLDMADAIKSYQEIFDSHAQKPEGWRAGLDAAKLYLEEKKYSEAADILKKIVDASLGIEFFQVQVRSTYIGVLEQLGRFEDAAHEAAKLVSFSPKNFLSDALFVQGNLLKKLNRHDEAEKVFARVLSEFAESDEARRVRALQLL